MKVWRSIDRFDPDRARLEAWAGRIAANACYDRLRKRGETLLDGETPDRPDASPRADALLDLKDSAAQVRAAVAALPPRQRAALELCAFRDHTNIEAADMLGISVEALESLLARARRTLKSELEADREALLDGLSRGQGGEP